MSDTIEGNPVNLFKGKRQLFSKRFTLSDKKTSITQLALMTAKLVAEDANTAFYVQEYNNRNFSSREDYIEYMANRIEFEWKKAKCM